MFSWASQQLEKLAQTVAPPPTDASSKFVYCCQRGDEQGALECVGEIPGAGVIVHQAKGQVPLHLACLHSMPTLVRALMSQVGADINVMDAAGNSPLHLAASSSAPNAIDVVKLLVAEFQANACAKNAAGQTPYDLAPLNVVRQYLLPIQLQEETRIALDNGGQGLPPGIDLGGLKIKNSHLPPPPSMHISPPPIQPQPPVHAHSAPPTTAMEQFPATVTNNAPPSTGTLEQPPPPAAPSSGPHEYARTGHSSAAIYNPAGKRVLKPDGFHSSSSDKRLQEKYGHVSVQYGSNVPPPPPSSGNSAGALAAVAGTGGTMPLPPGSGGYNPYAGGMSALGGVGRPASRRYVAYDPLTGQSMAVASTATAPASFGYSMPASTPAYSTFQPNASSSSSTASSYSGAVPAPATFAGTSPAPAAFASTSPAPAAFASTSPSPAAFASTSPAPAAFASTSPAPAAFASPAPMPSYGAPAATPPAAAFAHSHSMPAMTSSTFLSSPPSPFHRQPIPPSTASPAAAEAPSQDAIHSSIPPSPAMPAQSPFIQRNPSTDAAADIFASSSPERKQIDFDAPPQQTLQQENEAAVMASPQNGGDANVKSSGHAVPLNERDSLFSGSATSPSAADAFAAPPLSSPPRALEAFSVPPSEAVSSPPNAVSASSPEKSLNAHSTISPLQSPERNSFISTNREISTTSSSASDLFSKPSSPPAEDKNIPPAEEDEDGDMTEVPLTPSPTLTRSKMAEPTPSSGSNSLYDAIGMPPPPFSKK